MVLTVQHGSLDLCLTTQTAVQLLEHECVVVFVRRPDRLFGEVSVGVPGERRGRDG